MMRAGTSEGAPSTEEFETVFHFFRTQRFDQAQQTMGLLTNGISLLHDQNDPRVVLAAAHHFGMKPVKIASI
jgi:hypothetical protein